jgi:hypothetical protein
MNNDMKKTFTFLASLATSMVIAQSVPNGGFEQWQTYNYENPQYYQTSNYGNEQGGIVNGVNAQKTTQAYHGQYAVMLETILFNTPSGVLDTAFAFVANGAPSGNSGSAAGGAPISQKPTGVRFYYEYYSAYSNNNMSATPDSGLAIFEFKKAGAIIGQYIYKLVPTNSSPGYVLFNQPFSLSLTPDTVIVGFASSSNVINNGKGQPGSLLFIDSISFTGISSQPTKLNGDMENWMPMSKDLVFGWHNSNNYARTTDKYSGNYAIQLTTMQPLMDGLHPGEASSTSQYGYGGPFGGYPFSNQIDTLVFYYKYYPANYPTSVDTAGVRLLFMKNNAIIGGTSKNLTYTNVYKKVEIPFNVGQAPDTMSISFFSSINWPMQQSYNGSILYIDEVYLKSQKTPISFFGGSPADGCVGDTIHLVDMSDNAPSSWQWFMTGAQPTSTSTQQNPKIVYTNPGTYTISMQACDSFGCGGFYTRTIHIHALPQIQATTASMCTNTSATLSVSNILLTTDSAGANPYFWYDATGIIANGVSTVVSPSTTTVYTVSGSSQYGCTNTAITHVTVLQPPVPSICMVSTDSLSQYNIIYYDKTMYNNVDSFIAYREVSSNTYKRIAAQPYSALSQFIDTARSVGPANGDPNGGTYRYKIQTVDTCGNYSALSPYHNTIFILQGSNGQFSWTTPYQIEGTTSPDTSYVLMCDTANVNIWTAVASVSGSQQTVVDPGFIHHANIANWRVDGLGFNCNPTQRLANGGNNGTLAARVKSHSNSTNNRTTSSIKQVEGNSQALLVYPNPANTVINVQYLANSATVLVYDVLGNEVMKQPLVNKQSSLDISHLQSGVYFIKVGNSTQKFVKQ